MQRINELVFVKFLHNPWIKRINANSYLFQRILLRIHKSKVCSHDFDRKEAFLSTLLVVNTSLRFLASHSINVILEKDHNIFDVIFDFCYATLYIFMLELKFVHNIAWKCLKRKLRTLHSICCRKRGFLNSQILMIILKIFRFSSRFT